MWLPTLLFESAQRFPDRIALVFDEVRLTYAELKCEIETVAAGLQDKGLTAGTRAAIMYENGVEFVVSYFAVLATGASVITINALQTRPEVNYVLGDCRPQIFLSGGRVWDTAAASGQDCGIEVCDLASLKAERPFVRPPLGVSGAEAVIMYTSGTTGKPKGAVLTHDNLLMNAWVCGSQSMFNLTPDDVVLCCLPLFHASGQSCLMNTGLLYGATVVLMRQFVAADVLDVMQREKVTFFLGVPTMYVGLLNLVRPNKAELPAWRMAVSGGAPIPVAVLREIEALFEVEVYEGYGLTETSPTSCFNQRHYERRAGTIGKAIWGVDVEIAKLGVEDRIELVAPGEAGELVVRGHNVFAGYLNQPEATARAMVDGWFRTGDIGTKDVDGYVTIVDRKKDMIIRGGFNVYSREIEDVLCSHPAIALAAVVGRPDEVFGEEVIAVVELVPGEAEVTGDEIIAWSRLQLAKYKYPREVLIIPKLPIGPGGKILKREIAELVRAGSLLPV